MRRSQDLQPGLSDALAGDVPLNLGLVDPIDAGPDEGPADAYGPESVSPQRVWVKANGTIRNTTDIEKHADSKSFRDAFLLLWFQRLCGDYWAVEQLAQKLLQDSFSSSRNMLL